MTELRTLYPPIDPYDTGRLKVSELHEIYYEQVGNPDGKPVVFLHGGPGGGVVPEYRSAGLFPLLICELQKHMAINTPYKRAEFSWVLEDNHEINKTVERLGASRYKTYRIYQKALA